ncbi:MAG: hypothetical protein JKX97_01555, partial [Candidatus Lindowbacteria bacterium]|nr:hypothetical protein [Candidatus Lindowbacteria bacterium]
MAAKKTLFVWIWSDGKIGNIPSAVKNEVNQVVKTKKLKGELGELALLQAGEKTILLCGSGMIHPDSVGNEKGEARRNIAESVARAVSSASSFKFDAVMVGGLSSDEISSAFRGVGISQYSFKVGKKRGKGIDVTIKAATAKENSFAKKMRTAVWLTQDLVNTPPDDKSPIKMTSWVMRELKKDTKNLKIKIWNEKKIKSERCGGILAVARGSSQQPRVMRMEYSPPGAKKHIVLVGKGVTFDSGGLNVKTYPGMKAMKCDMAGAAVVVGAIKAAASIGLKVKITGLIGMVENMSGADAYKPGDVVKMRSGKTVEVLNTDAEGRMVLADLLDIAKG